ncbi:CpaB family protein, partial [Couchioplanes caeruleus]
AEPAAKAGSTGTKSAAGMLVTVAVTQEEAEKLLHVSLTGVLSLALLDDTATVQPDEGIDNNSLFP